MIWIGIAAVFFGVFILVATAGFQLLHMIDEWRDDE